MTENSNTTLENDPTLLKVAGAKIKGQEKENLKKLANAILRTIENHGIAKLRCVGAAAVNHAEKAFIIASLDAVKNEVDLVQRSYFVDVDFDGNIKTGIVKEVFALELESSEDYPEQGE